MISRGRYGIEYFPRPERERSGGYGWIVVAVVVLALGSLAWTLVCRLRGDGESAEPRPAAPAAAPAVETNAPPPVIVTEKAPPLPEPVIETLVERPVKLRNLLLRLKESEEKGDLELTATTIEQIREHPQAADLDDTLARQLGVLNLKRLYERRYPKWVKRVEVKRGDSATRIAADHNSTLASMQKLNGSKLDVVRLGDRLYVMSNPHFTLVVRRRPQTADLMLEDRFFKRYDLCAPVTGKDGVYKTTAKLRNFLRELGIGIAAKDRSELETLVPKGSSVTISEM